MRPGLVFIGLFAVLILTYALLQDTLGSVPIFLLQATIVAVLLAAATWFRYRRTTGGWSLGRSDTLANDTESSNEAEPAAGSPADKESEAEMPRAS